MRNVQIQLTVPDRSAAAVYATLSDFRRYPEFSPAVRSVTVTESSDDVAVSRWEVNFRKGLLRWSEEDRFDAGNHRIAFRQLEGDVAVFDGSWTCAAVGDDVAVTFSARLDMGIPSLADALEPIAVRTLVDNTVSIVDGLFGGTARVDAVAAQAG
jgi:ribosome-associated toxin RatA of RatAB toxin-antitoxin module